MSKFTIGILLFSDRAKGEKYHELHLRCLNSLSHLRGHADIRIWCNDVCPETLEYIRKFRLECSLSRVWAKDKNHFKYPAMREMLYGTSPVNTPYFMWFDDDSYLEKGVYPDWLDRVEAALQASHMVGSKYYMSLRPGQKSWILQQPWYNGVKIQENEKISFCTGGWWAIRTEVLTTHDWPSAELIHRGGDVMLGALCQQQGYRLGNFREGVRINADKLGKESASPRRGYDGPAIGCVNHGRGTGIGENQETT